MQDYEEIIRAYLSTLKERFSCKEIQGRLWVISPYTYPDGDYIEIVISERADGEISVSDLGETLRHLRDHGFDPTAIVNGKYLLKELMSRFRVEIEGGVIQKRVGAEPGEAILDVVGACFAAGDLLYLSRSYQPGTFVQDVFHWLQERKVSVERNYTVEGLTKKRYKVHFFLPKVRDTSGLLQTLSPKSIYAVKRVVDATFRLWSDVGNDGWNGWKGSLLDDRILEWKNEDIDLLKRVSPVYSWSDRERMVTSWNAHGDH